MSTDDDRRNMRQKWHEQVNRHADNLRAEKRVEDADSNDWPRFMYEAIDLFDEVPRMARLHGRERRGELTTTTRHCSFSPVEAVPDNHLTCCLGVKCRECPHLLALDKAELTPEQIDEAKAWTCASHIAASGGDVANEGYLLTVDDRMFWDRTHASLAAGLDGTEPTS